jgi:hypothetical protein
MDVPSAPRMAYKPPSDGRFREELRDVASALRQVATLMKDMPPATRTEVAMAIYRSLEARLDAMDASKPEAA